MKNIVIGIHGFGADRTEEFNIIKSIASEENIEFVCFELFGLHDAEPKYQYWIKKAEDFVNEYLDKGYKVDLIGFSMGGVIASFLCTYLKINRLVLISPAFYFLSSDNLIKLSEKVLMHDSLEHTKQELAHSLPLSYYLEFCRLVKKLKVSIELVENDLLIIYGTDDEFVPKKSVMYAYNNCKSTNKKLVFYHNARHELHVAGVYKYDVSRQVLSYLKMSYIEN